MTDTDFDVMPDGRLVPIRSKTRGGARPGAGRKKKQHSAEARVDADLFGEVEEPEASSAVRFDRAKTRKEEALAGIHELNLQVQSGAYLPRAAFREASATLLSTVSQALRSLPDILERKHNLPAATLQDIESAIDQVLNEAADSLSLFTDAK